MLKKRRDKRAAAVVLAGLSLVALTLLLQSVWAHRGGFFVPDYPQIEIAELLAKNQLLPQDYRTLFEQTGLGKQAVDALRSDKAKGNAQILRYQQTFFAPRSVKCAPMLGWFTREDILVDERGNPCYAPPYATLQPGDILVSLSTHSMGWNHGHAGLVLDGNVLLESRVLGENSIYSDVHSFRHYSNYAVLRIKDQPPQAIEQAVKFAQKSLYDVPYRLTAGLFGDKMTAIESKAFGLQCAYLVWYSWQQFDVDLDTRGGRLVTPLDLLLSERVEIVQVYGMNPRRLNQPAFASQAKTTFPRK